MDIRWFRFKRIFFISAVLVWSVCFVYYHVSISIAAIALTLPWPMTDTVLVFSRLSTLPVPLVAGPFVNSTPSEAFVVFSDNTPHYLALLESLLDSVHHFSTRPVIAYGIDVDLNLDTRKYSRLIKRRLSRKDCGWSIYFCKIHAIIDSQVDYGVQLEADSVVNWNIDVLFDVLHRWEYPIPLAPRHPNDPMNYKTFLKIFHLRPYDRTSPYVHAQFSWNYRAYPFFRRALAFMQHGHFVGANFDETAINILLWQARADHTLCRIDPFYANIDRYENQNSLCQDDCHMAFIFLHGSKRSKDLRNIFERLKVLAGSPFVLTKNHGFHYLNETRYTCCYPDSYPSPIHPLLCRHSHHSGQNKNYRFVGSTVTKLD